MHPKLSSAVWKSMHTTINKMKVNSTYTSIIIIYINIARLIQCDKYSKPTITKINTRFYKMEDNTALLFICIYYHLLANF
ncbi:hypothetical protein E2986_11747 [Frieseomelitta varia]|uniref:Uncharacterized protein n=1 Tax=Frieseomelitta varia TaxID=561572 RepID=A0A833VZU4_9HYME|nr:hypothetical protein E2986_11747 [Frieseomelitta varia]